MSVSKVKSRSEDSLVQRLDTMEATYYSDALLLTMAMNGTISA